MPCETHPHACKCRKCGGEMLPGQALLETRVGTPDFIGGEVQTFSVGGPGRLAPCMKCKECGWSVSGDGKPPFQG